MVAGYTRISTKKACRKECGRWDVKLILKIEFPWVQQFATNSSMNGGNHSAAEEDRRANRNGDN